MLSFFYNLLADIQTNAVQRKTIEKLESENADLKDEIASLKDDLRQAKTENKRFAEENKSPIHTNTLDETEIQILSYLATRPEFTYATFIASELNQPVTIVEACLEKLSKQHYVKSFRRRITKAIEYRLDQKGKEYLVENDLLT